MGLGTDRDHGIRKVLNSTAPNPEAESGGIRTDIAAAVWGSGTVFPTGATNLWPGRLFLRTDLDVLYVYDGAEWLSTRPRWEHVTSGADSTPFTAAAGAQLQFRTGYVKSFTDANQRIVVGFGTAFPTRCLGVLATTIEGTAVAPVIESRAITAAQATLKWPGHANASLAATWLAWGY